MTVSQPTTPAEKSGVISAALDVLMLVELLAIDYQPRTLAQVAGLTAEHQREWSRTKIFNMLATLQASGWAVKDSADRWSLSPQFAVLACAYYQALIARSRQVRDDLQKLDQSIHERIQNV